MGIVNFSGISFFSIDETPAGVYRLRGRLEASEEDLRLIRNAEEPNALRKRSRIPYEDFSEFLVVRYNLLQLRHDFGDPCFYVQYHESMRETGQMSFEELLRGPLADQPHVPLRTTFGFDPFGELDSREGRRVEIVLPEFEEANDLIGAMFSPRFRFFPIPMFAGGHDGISRVSAQLEDAKELSEFRRRLLGAFSIIMQFNKEGLISLLTTDEHLAREQWAARVRNHVPGST